MAVFKTTLKIIRPKGKKTDLSRALSRPMLRIGKRLSAIGLEAARNNYMSKRKTTKMPSFIFGSFTYGGTKLTGLGKVTSVVFAGGENSKAPYAVYVDVGHALRNGEWWEGYHFMKAGIRKSLKEFPRIAKEEISKTLKNVTII